MNFVAIGLGLYVAVVIPLAIIVHGCAHEPVIPTSCNGVDQVRDPQHRVNGVSDCYACLPGAIPGALNDGNHYRCRDYTCNECETPVVPFGARLRICAGCKRVERTSDSSFTCYECPDGGGQP